MFRTSEVVKERLTAWLDERLDKVEYAAFSLSNDVFIFTVVQKQVPCDDILQDELTDLDIEINNNPKMCRHFSIDCMLLPNVSMNAASMFMGSERLWVWPDWYTDENKETGT